jgi:hypothetical protein
MLAVVTAAGATEVTGTVRSARAEGNIVHLTLDDPHAPQIVLLIGWLSHFPTTPDRYYLGKAVTVRGKIQSFHGAREIHVRDASDITVHEAVAPSVVGDANGSQSQIDELRNRVRSLEERVRALEQREH